jgi:starch synthase (maltosyl-transferring)
MGGWEAALRRAAEWGFTYVCLAPLLASRPPSDIFLADNFERAEPRLEAGDSALEAIRRAAALARQVGLELLLDVVLDRVDGDGAAARTNPELFTRPFARVDVVDPRASPADLHSAIARFDEVSARRALLEVWSERLSAWRDAGVAGFRLLGLDCTPPDFIADLVHRVQGVHFLGWTLGASWQHISRFEGIGLDGVFASTPWWDGRASWYLAEHDILRRIAPVLAPLEAPFGPRLAQRALRDADHAVLYRQVLQMAAATSDGLLVPMGFEWLSEQRMDARFPVPFDLVTIAPLREDIIAANGLIDSWARRDARSRLRRLGSSARPVAQLELVGRDAVVAANLDLSASHDGLAAGEVRIVPLERKPAIVERLDNRPQALKSAMTSPRIVIENVTPFVEGGPFPARSIVHRPVTVEADIYMDGHDVLAAELLLRPADEDQWQRRLMTALPNDRWQASFVPDRIGRWRFTVEAWLDEYATLCRSVLLKHEVRADIATELAEMRLLLKEAAASGKECSATALAPVLATLDRGDIDATVKALTSAETRRLVADTRHQRFATRHEPLPLDVERREAGFASWYELFPRSQTDDRRRHGTFADVIRQLPRVREMGFDVLYLPPIHPVGTSARKGRNNSLIAEPDDVGSVYAIGGPEGGHDAVHPALGTLEDFRRLVEAAHAHELEIALDFAIQCSPDHPWLREHADWFSRRPDGTIKHAENPPKKYEDIVNVDFYAPAALPALWETLRDVVLFWIGHGVKIFRVDNPHTKPLPFWQWMIADVRGRHPDVIFLSEAFTRPKMMYRLAKVGFSQSYTYFTWRNTRQELADYLTELTTGEVAKFFRPNFFVNTPDINPYYLQSSGRAGFLVRAVLASTLSGLWGVYSGFELCEAAPLPGREEYLDSEKYEIRVRDFDAPGNIVGEITALNRLRRFHPALQSHLGLRFYASSNEQVLVYGKALPSHEDMVFVAVNLDPHRAQESNFEIPLWEWQLPDNGTLRAEDLMSGRAFSLYGKRQWLRLDPAAQPFVIWRLMPEGAP